MAREPRRLSGEERALWEKTASDVTPLARADGEISETPEPEPEPGPELKPEPPAPKKPKPDLRRRTPPKADKPAAAFKPLSEDSDMELDRRERRALKRGRVPMEAKLDMHGMRQHEAKAALADFIETAHARGLGAVMVVTGKGARGDDSASGAPGAPGVLRRMTPKWLRAAPLAARIIGFAPAAQGHGGDGALYVRLKKPRKARGK